MSVMHFETCSWVVSCAAVCACPAQVYVQLTMPHQAACQHHMKSQFLLCVTACVYGVVSSYRHILLPIR